VAAKNGPHPKRHTQSDQTKNNIQPNWHGLAVYVHGHAAEGTHKLAYSNDCEDDCGN
jgi:hypothetical protein